MAPRKFIGLRSDMEGVIRKYNDSNKNLNVLIEELDLGKDYFKATDEVFFVKVPPEKFTFDFPNGNEGEPMMSYGSLKDIQYMELRKL